MGSVASALAAVLIVAAWLPGAAAGLDCAAARCSVEAELARECPCDAAATHGARVRCVARVLDRLAAAGDVPAECKGRIKRCAARSTCGRRAGSVVCETPIRSGTCAIGLGFCVVEGEPLYSRPCSSDADCVLERRCAVSASAERCLARGGTVAPRASCCPDCVPPPPTPCGATICTPDEICVGREPIGPARVLACEPVPAGCEFDRTCGCAGGVLCQYPFDRCLDDEAPGELIVCVCDRCQ